MFTLKVSETVSLKLLDLEDAEALFSVVNESRVHLREWLPWVDGALSPEGYRPVIGTWLKQFADHNGFQAGILVNGELAGMIGFHPINWMNRSTSVGYWLGDRFQGGGVMTASVSALLDYAFTSYKLHRVEIRCGVDNLKSRAIPERLGFQLEGIQRDAEFLYDHFHDLAVYSKLSTDQ
ncbi:ribosomal-protein-serine acetyltransferase [Sporosarcina sp. NCCP-2716]|uniref:GNAT family N-acetyltransferase n=1 Tax=Sporosarcina sp. NCCP-2716 TaxID=2943679 RepID=UPI00203D18A0|nr:GNAT family protein [Sporosarcina sp. NCCP-2716]GKV68332.1 ribosomal-protein-serine acetyltransferase [Sporosarcina sp. NCCP-2716]